MKRDMDLIRKVLIELENCPHPNGPGGELHIEGFSNETVSYHVKILYEAGLIEAHEVSSFQEYAWWPQSLTWEGHEFLDAARDKNRWEKAKKLVMEKAGGLMFEALKIALMQGIKNQLT